MREKIGPEWEGSLTQKNAGKIATALNNFLRNKKFNLLSFRDGHTPDINTKELKKDPKNRNPAISLSHRKDGSVSGIRMKFKHGSSKTFRLSKISKPYFSFEENQVIITDYVGFKRQGHFKLMLIK